MAQFIAFGDRIEVNGQAIFAVKKGLGPLSDRADEIFYNRGLREIEPLNWYDHQQWLDCLRELRDELGEATLFRIGIQIPEAAVFPPNISDVHSALASIDIAYHMNHRSNGQVMINTDTGAMLEGIGHYSYKKIGSQSAIMTCHNPYPCSFDNGIIQAMTKRFSPIALIKHDDLNCRKLGSEWCEYQVNW